jgi:hypothetical protein
MPVMAQTSWRPLPTSVGLGIGGRWSNDVSLGGAGRQLSVRGAGPAWNLSGAFGWSRGALRLGGVASYERLVFTSDLSGTESGPLRGLERTDLEVTAAHFFSAGPAIGAQIGADGLTGFAEIAILADLTAAEVQDSGPRLGLRFVPTARVGGSFDLGGASIELWLYGSALVTPRVGLVFGLGF